MRTRKIKWAALMAGVTVSVLALAGCTGGGTGGGSANSKSTTDGAGKTITVYIGANTSYAQQQRQWFKDVSSAFQKKTGAKVRFETYASGNDELTKIQTSVVSNQGPDIYVLGTTFTPTAYSTGAFVKLTPEDWKKIGGKSKFIPSSLGISGPNSSNQIGIPFASRPFVMAYNTDLLAKAGISKPATTWDGLAEQAKKLTGNGIYGMSVGYKDNYDPWKYIWAMDRQSGHKMVDGKTAKVDAPATMKAYQTYFGWLTKDHVVDPASVGWSNSEALANFASGKAAFFPMTTATSLNTLNKSAVKDTYKYALMPTVPPGATSLPAGGVPVASILSGDNMVVAQYSKNQDLDFALVKFLTDDAQQKIQYNVFGNLPVNKATAKELESSNPVLKPIVAAAAGSYATPFTGAWGDIELSLVNVVVQSIPDLAKGSVSDSSLRSLLEEAQKTSQDSLSRAH